VQSLPQCPTVCEEPPRTRPDFAPLACVNPACQRFRRPGAANLPVRKVSGHARSRLLRCRTGGEACSERRGRAVFHPKLPAASATEVINPLGAGGRVRATARLVTVAKATVARLGRVAGRQAPRGHDQPGHALTPGALAVDAQWRVGQQSRSAAATLRPLRPGPWGIRPRAPLRGSWGSLASSAHGPTRRPRPECMRPNGVSGGGLSRCASPMLPRAMSPPS
jgi:hypothetical protein